MALIFRKNQNVPLSNSQLDGNFEFLRDQLSLKYDIIDFTADNISVALNTPATVSAGVVQTPIELAESNSLDAWTMRTLEPSSTIPDGVNKSSVVTRGEDGEVRATVFFGDLDGNAGSATTAESADSAKSLANTYTVPVERGGTAANTKADARASLEVLHTGGDNVMTAKLTLAPSSGAASIGFGVGQNPSSTVDGDMWSRADGLYYRAAGSTHKIAPTNSPVFTGQPQAPDANGVSSQVATLSHLNDTRDALNDAIDLKSNIDSPTFTGTPNAPTAAKTVNNTRIATTAFVHTAVDDKATDLTTAYETYTTNAVSDLNTTIQTLLNAKANLASPVFTGVPVSTTPARGDVSTKIATTAFTADALDQLNQSIQSALSTITTLVNSTRPVPAGSVFYIASSIVPNGYLEAAGQAVSKLTYPTLWAALGSPNPASGDAANTFRLPDLRGEFIRGWDHGRGVDSGRNLGTPQIDQIGAHSHDYVDTYYSEAWGNGQGPQVGSGRTDYDNYDYNKSRTTASTGGNETRPRNVALMAIIKY